METIAQAPTVHSDDSTRLAVERTRLAHERTLMAWVRTATSLISFGFTIYKFFEYLKEANKASPVSNALNPRRFGMAMIVVGLLSLMIAAFQHHRDLKLLEIRYGKGPTSMAYVLAFMVALLGVLAFVGVLLRE